MKKKVLLSSILTIALCLSLIAGSTYALFTSQTEVNIAVTAGKVDVVASLTNLKLYSVEPDNANGDIEDEYGKLYSYEEQSDKFLNEGTAVIDGGTLTLDRVTPGDKVEFNVAVKNNSDVAIAYRYTVSCTDGYSLMYGLKVTIDGTTYEHLDTYVSEWEDLVAKSAIDDIKLVIELPVTAGNEYQTLSTDINVKVEAIQGNANLDAAPAVTYIEKIDSSADFEDALEEGGNITGLGETVKLDDMYSVTADEVSIQDITLDASEADAALNTYGDQTTVILNENANIVAGAFGVFLYGSYNDGADNTLIMNEGSNITANDANTYAIYVQDGNAKIYLNASGLITLGDASAQGIMVGASAVVDIYVPTEDLYDEYKDMVVTDGTACTITWYVNGVKK